MPSLLKDRPTGRLGRLISALRPARAGPLPVQTGFPTSLADLFVKNHGRLRKPSSCASPTSRRKKRGAPPLPSPPASPAPSPPTSSPPSPPPPAAVSPTVQPRSDPPLDEPVCHTRDGSPFGLGLGFLALVGVVISLSILVIWSRKVVAAVTVAAFSLFLLESVRSLSLFRRRPRAPATKEPDFGGRGYVSPIREVEAEPEPPRRSCSDSDRWTDDVVSIPASTEDDRIEERSEAGDESSSSSKARSKRRSWKKLIPRKLQKGRIRQEAAEADSPSVSFRSESSEADGNAKAPDSRRGSGRHHHQADAVAKSSGSPHVDDGPGLDGEARGNGGPIEIDASADLTPAGVDELGGGGGGSRVPFVAAVVVVLVGLVAGRLPAVAFTVLLVSSLQRLSCRGMAST